MTGSSGSSSKAVVIVSAIAPPQPNAGAARIESLVRYLPELGWEPIVVSSRLAGEGQVGTAETLRVGDPTYWYRHLRHGTQPGRAVPRELEHVATPARGLKALLASALEHAVPDQFAGWIPGAALAAIGVARRRKAHAIMSSSPPESSHVAALVAAKATGLPWLAEFRDGWMFEGLRPERGPLRAGLDSWLERTVCTGASALVGVTRGIAADLERRYGAGHWVPNGFDDEPIPEWAFEEARRLVRPGFFNVVYTGTFWVSKRTRSPQVLADAMGRLRSEPGGSEILLTIVGALHPRERELLNGTEGIQIEPHRPRPVALALQRLADALVVVSPESDLSVVPGKFYEYLGSGRPVVVAAPDGSELTELAREVRVPGVVSSDDGAALARALLSLASGKITHTATEAPARFHRRRAAGEITRLLTAIS